MALRRLPRVSSTVDLTEFSGRGRSGRPNGVAPGLLPTAAEGRVKKMRRCEQQPSPNARETRPPRGRVFRFLRSVFEGWARAVGAAVSRGLHHGVARLPRWPTEWAESLSGSLAGQGAGLREGRSRWSGHYPRGRPRWGGPDPLRTTDRGLWLRGAPTQQRKPNARPPYSAACTRSKRPRAGRGQRPALGPS